MNTCRSCRAPIVWAHTEQGNPMPVDRDPVPGGNLVFVPRLFDFDQAPPVVHVITDEAAIEGEPERYVSHFATCPHADEHRRTP